MTRYAGPGRGAILEYTRDEVAASFKELKSNQLEVLKSLPRLFAYEGKTEDMRVGRLTAVKTRGRDVLIEYELAADIPPIPYAAIEPLRHLLDIRDWELNRTHWAVKEEDAPWLAFAGRRLVGNRRD